MKWFCQDVLLRDCFVFENVLRSSIFRPRIPRLFALGLWLLAGAGKLTFTAKVAKDAKAKGINELRGKFIEE